MSAAPAKKKKPAAKTAKKTATKAPAKAAPKTAKKAAAPKAPARTAPKATAPDRPSAPPAVPPAPAAAASGPAEVCPRCGTATFGPEERTRWEGRRTVRYTVLVCERGHTFAHPVVKGA